MLIYTNQISTQPSPVFPYPKENTIYFDIETTGFSPAISNIYLIGCIYYTNNHFELIQWFADDYESEASILLAFKEFISAYSHIVHFNGNHFDIPYLEDKYKKHHINSPFFDKISIDIYKEVRPYHNLFQTDNLKQKTLELFLHKERKDIYDGGQLIEVYNQYMQLKYKSQDNTLQLESLLLHNKEDLTGLLSVTELFAYTYLSNSTWEQFNLYAEENTLHIYILNKYLFPVTFTRTISDITIHFEQNICTLTIPIFSGTLKYFYQDYKNYYYLPAEDAAIHKSVASFVDTAYRRKATASNCYQKKTGLFLPVFDKEIDLPVFRENYKSKQKYVLCDESFLQNTLLAESYIRLVINIF